MSHLRNCKQQINTKLQTKNNHNKIKAINTIVGWHWSNIKKISNKLGQEFSFRLTLTPVEEEFIGVVDNEGRAPPHLTRKLSGSQRECRTHLLYSFITLKHNYSIKKLASNNYINKKITSEF